MTHEPATHGYYTIGEVADALGIPKHNIRLWESRFRDLKPLRLNGRRYYSEDNVDLIRRIYHLIYVEGRRVEDTQREIEGHVTPSLHAGSPREPTRTAAASMPPASMPPNLSPTASLSPTPPTATEPVTLVSLPASMQKRLSRLIRESLDLRAKLSSD